MQLDTSGKADQQPENEIGKNLCLYYAGMALDQDNQDAHPNFRGYHPSGHFRQDDGTG